MMIRTLLFLLLIICFSCENRHQKLLSGHWEATALIEEDSLLNFDVSVVQFDFHSDKTYQFQSTLNYKESGTFRLKKDLLYTQDTLVKKTSEKAVRIILLTEDSLHLKMNDSGKERLMKLIRKETES